MKAAVLFEPGTPLSIDDVSVDKPAAHEVPIRTAGVGVCRSGKRLQGGLMGGNRFPVDLPRLVDLYQRGLLDLDTIIAERLPLERINHAFDALRKGDATRSVVVFG